MMMTTNRIGVLLRVAAFAAAFTGVGCDEQETTAIVDNDYPATEDGGFDSQRSISVYRAWWLVTVFADPIAASTSSDPHRVVPGADTAYFLLAPGWDPSSGDPPSSLIVAKTSTALQISKGSSLHIVVDDAHVIGNCATGHPLTQADADFITGSIFAGEFAGLSYEAATCRTLVTGIDAGLKGAD